MEIETFANSATSLIDAIFISSILRLPGLPVRGQRSKTNARTRKGPKKTIANKKK